MAFVMPSLDNVLGLAPRDNASDPCALVNQPGVNASIQLSSWMECQINGTLTLLIFMAFDAFMK